MNLGLSRFEGGVMNGTGRQVGASAGFLTALTVLSMVASAAACAGLDREAPAAARAYTAHDPIKITGNDDLTAANGVTGGTGTKENPYVISGWEITAASGHGMEVLETHGNYLTIRDCKV